MTAALFHMPRAPSICTSIGCPDDAVSRGRCAAHQRKPWATRSPSSHTLNGPGKAAHRRARRSAAVRAAGACEDCGKQSTELALHHDHPISQGGATVQPAARMLCPTCHRIADQTVGVRS